jgi:glycosyltransferase involved in cell wall biosynthesis
MTRSLPAAPGVREVVLCASQDPRVAANGVNSHSRALAGALTALGVPVRRLGPYDGAGRLPLLALRAARAAGADGAAARAREAATKLALMRRRVAALPRLPGRVVHAQDYLAAVASLRMVDRPPVVLTHHANSLPVAEAVARYGLAGGDPSLRSLAALEAEAYGGASRICCVSTWARDLVAGAGLCSPDRIVVVPSGVPVPEDPPPRPAGRGRLVIVAQLVHRKGVDVALRAVAAAARDHPQLALTVVGDGPERASLERLAAELGVAERVRFTGALPAPEAELRAADLFVLPSRLDNLPMALLEAMAAGLPVVASRVGGVPDAVLPGTTGLLVPPDDPAALAAAVSALVADPARAAALGAAAHALARRHFSLEAMGRGFLKVYGECLAQ